MGVRARARKLYIIHNIIQEDKQPKREKEHAIQVFFFFFFFFVFVFVFV